MDQQIKTNMDRYGVTEHEAQIMVERGKVYGDPVENHEFIAKQITGLLSPWVHRIAANLPLPPHVIALILCALKMSRQRRVFHEDNYDDMSVYQRFARTWHREWEANARSDMEKPIASGTVVRTSGAGSALDQMIEARDKLTEEILKHQATGQRKEHNQFGHQPQDGASLIAAERQKEQLRLENTTVAVIEGELVRAAKCYLSIEPGDDPKIAPSNWPWYPHEWQPGNEIGRLVKAGALIAEEIDRLQRQGP